MIIWLFMAVAVPLLAGGGDSTAPVYHSKTGLIYRFLAVYGRCRSVAIPLHTNLPQKDWCIVPIVGGIAGTVVR